MLLYDKIEEEGQLREQDSSSNCTITSHECKERCQLLPLSNGQGKEQRNVTEEWLWWHTKRQETVCLSHVDKKDTKVAEKTQKANESEK